MKEHAGTFVALLRGINVGGHNNIPMSDLLGLCAGLGWGDVQSYIQSGNLVFTAAATPAALEAELEQAIAHRFGLQVPVMVRGAVAWSAYVRGNPFSEEAEEEPNRVLLAVSKEPPQAGAVAGLCAHAAHGERVAQVGAALWIHYSGGVARSKLTPALLDRVVGSPVTARNWRTVLKLSELTGI